MSPEGPAVDARSGGGRRPGPVRRLYDWVIHWAGTPMAVPALAILAIAEASFFPVPPDVLLIAMALARPRRGFYYATVATAASVVGGLGGYYIGIGLMSAVGCHLVSIYHGQAVFDHLATLFTHYGFWAVFTAAVTPLPYKIFTISAGAVHLSLGTFLAASILGRPVRFFLLAALIFFFGEPVKKFIDRYFNSLLVAFVVLLIGGFAVFRVFGGGHGKGHAGGPKTTESAYARICPG